MGDGKIVSIEASEGTPVKDVSIISPNQHLLEMLPIPASEREHLVFNQDGVAYISKQEGIYDSHDYRIQIIQGGAGLRFEAPSDKNGLVAWKQEIVEMPDGGVVTEETIEPHLSSRMDNKDQHIKSVQKRAEYLMRSATREFKGLDESFDPFYIELMDKVRTGQDRVQWDLHGYNTETIVSKSTIKPGLEPQVEIVVVQQILGKKDEHVLDYDVHTTRAKFSGGRPLPESVSTNIDKWQVRR